MTARLTIFLLGLGLAIFSHPRLRHVVMSRLANEGVVTPKTLPAAKTEIIRHAGSSLGLLFLGVALMLLSLFISTS